MGTYIESVATAHERGHVFGRGARHLTDVAASACLQRAHHKPAQLDLLINAGIYKDHNAAEPALASIIQRDIGANPASGVAHAHGTFSFDILNGGCGVLTAAQLVAAFVGSGRAHHGMVVAGDADPSPRTSRHFPFAPAGGAMLVAHADGAYGFQQFEFRTFPEYAALFEVDLHWEPHAGLLRRGRNIVEVREDPAFAGRCIELAAVTTEEFLARHGLHTNDIDLVIASQYPRSFAHSVATRLEIPSDRLPAVPAPLTSTHTAGPIAALEAAFASGQFARARHTLFVTVGAGITVGLGLYTREAL